MFTPVDLICDSPFGAMAVCTTLLSLCCTADGLLTHSRPLGTTSPQLSAMTASNGPLAFTPSRRALLQAFATSPLLMPLVAHADDKPAPKWISGKSDPLRPTSKDKPDGTKKDNRYVSCLNDCVPRKQGPPGPNQKERVDCLDECQVECCETYEQCTYTIRK
jgi:hypothetical protein